MRFAIVTETYPPEVNGVALTVASLEQGLRTLRHSLHVVRPRRPSETCSDANTSLVPSVPLPRYRGLRLGLPCAARLRREWQAERPDAVYVATEGPLGWSALRAASRLGIPTATGFHTRFDSYMSRYGAGLLAPLAFNWLRCFHNHGDATLVPTTQLADLLRVSGFRNVTRLGRAVDTRQFDVRFRDAALRRLWGLEDHGLAVIHVGRIAPEKNLELAVSSFRAIQVRRPDARFVWVGNGPSRATLQRENPDFIFAGMLRGTELSRHFASADLFVFPSTSETFGNVTLEAMASGVATVAYDYGAAREHIRDGVNGRTLDVDDSADFIGAAVALATDDDLRKRLARAGRRAVEGLSTDAVARQFERILIGLAHCGPRERAA